MALFMIENFLSSNINVNKSVYDYKSLFLSGTAPWVALGDSHTANSLKSSSIIDNLGYASDNLESMSIKSLHRIKRHKPKGVILQATPHIFSFYRLSDNQEKKTEFLTNNDEYIFKFLNPINRPYLLNYLKLIIKNKFLSNSKVKKSLKLNKSWDEKPLSAKNYETSTRIQLHMPISDFKNHFSLVTYKNMIDSTLKLNIDVCLVRYPVTSTYLDKTNKIELFNELNTTIQEIAKSYDINFVDLSNSLEDKSFADPDHILSTSKETVTDLVKKGCKINE